MKNLRFSLIAVACIATASLGLAAAADEHAVHRPDAASASATGASTAKAKSAKAKAVPKAVTVSPMDQQMQAMQAMHDKMMNAKSMDERRGMLDEQMKSMESGMAMMDRMGVGAQPATPATSSASAPGGMDMDMGMGSGGMPAQHASMMKRMEMMQMMMRMMMDRLSVEPAK